MKYATDTLDPAGCDLSLKPHKRRPPKAVLILMVVAAMLWGHGASGSLWAHSVGQGCLAIDLVGLARGNCSRLCRTSLIMSHEGAPPPPPG